MHELVMHELEIGLNADKFASFWMFPKSFPFTYCHVIFIPIAQKLIIIQ